MREDKPGIDRDAVAVAGADEFVVGMDDTVVNSQAAT